MNTVLSKPSNKFAFDAYDDVPNNEPVRPDEKLTLPVNVADPVTSKLPVISNVSVFKVKGVPEPDITKEPEIVSVPINVLLPVVAKLLVLAFKDDVYVNILALNVFIEDVNAVNDAVWAANEPVSVNTVLSKPSNSSALDAYDAEAIEPEIVIPPVAIILPVTIMLPWLIRPFFIINSFGILLYLDSLSSRCGFIYG